MWQQVRLRSKSANVLSHVRIASHNASRLACPGSQNFRINFAEVARVNTETKRDARQSRGVLRNFSRAMCEVSMNAVDLFPRQHRAHSSRLCFNWFVG